MLAPYSALLAAETREALGLRLEGSVLIVDEAHNLGEGLLLAVRRGAYRGTAKGTAAGRVCA